MQVPDFTVEDLKKLPLRAIVALAARCARRVEHLAQLPQGHPQHESRRAAVEAALCMAESYAAGSSAPPEESVLAAIEATRCAANGPAGNEDATIAVFEAAKAAAAASRLTEHREPGKNEPFELQTAETRKFLGSWATFTAELAALSAFTAAVEAFASVGYQNEAFVSAAVCDYNKLVRLELGHYPEEGAAVDPSPNGPLGPV
jgi:hypothetical protein